MAGERLENHFDLLLQEFSDTACCWVDKHLRDTQDWMEENMGALTKLVSHQAQSLCKWLEKYAQDLSTWLNVNFGTLHECQDTDSEAYGYELVTEILAHDEHSEENINMAGMWLDQDEQLGEPLSEDLLSFYKVLETYANNVSSSLGDYAHIYIQSLKDLVEMLKQLRDRCKGAISAWLEEHDAAEEAPFQKYTRDLSNTGPQTEELGSAEAVVQQVKGFSFMKQLEKHAGALEQWLQSITEGGINSTWRHSPSD